MKMMKPKMKKMGGDMEMSQPRFAARAMRPGGMKKGGTIMAIKDTPTGRKMAGAAMGAKKYAKGSGVEMKGKTKGKVV